MRKHRKPVHQSCYFIHGFYEGKIRKEKSLCKVLIPASEVSRFVFPFTPSQTASCCFELCRRITDRHGWLIRRDNNTLIGNLLYDMVRFYDENGVETDMQRSARIYRMFDLLLSPSAAEQSADTPVEQAIQYIRSHIGQPISVEELASTVCLSASYFAHMFKRRTGFSPADYVINSRIERAKVLLVRTQKPIAEIAEEVGYSTSGSLINLFVKKVGTSPRQYRIQHMSKAIDAVCKTDVPFIDTDVPEL